MLSAQTKGLAQAAQEYQRNEGVLGTTSATRLEITLKSVYEAIARVRSMTGSVVEINRQLTGSSGLPPTESPELTNGERPCVGIVGDIENAVQDLHTALYEHEVVLGHLQRCSIVA
jgi:hypothetical protein